MNVEPKDLNLSTIAKRFSDEGESYLFLESVRWPDGPICPHCGSVGHAYFLTPKDGVRLTNKKKPSARRVWKCADCRKQFSVLQGSIFEGSHIPLFKWLLAFHMLASAKNGVAAYELHRTLDISVESAWFMAHRIRYVLDGDATNEKLTGTVEADETYFGGEAKNMHAVDRARKIHGRGTSGKVPVVSLVERGGRVRSQVVADVSGKTLAAVVRKQADPSAALMTDTAGAYGEVGREFASPRDGQSQRGRVRARERLHEHRGELLLAVEALHRRDAPSRLRAPSTPLPREVRLSVQHTAHRGWRAHGAGPPPDRGEATEL